MIPVVRVLKFIYYTTIVAAFCANMIVVSQTTTLSVLGAGMALRGPDGSMIIATDGLYNERSSVFWYFAVGLANTVGSVTVCVWLILHWEAALSCMIIVLLTCRTIWINYKRVERRFIFDESETVDFRDIMEGPANIQAVFAERRIRSPHERLNDVGNYFTKKEHDAACQSKFSSMEEGNYHDREGEWYQSSIDRDMKKRKGVRPGSGIIIQTI